MIGVIFAWIPRDIYPGKPPYFGGRPTWVFVKKLKINKYNEEKIKEIIRNISEEIPARDYKLLLLAGRGNTTLKYFKVRIFGEEEFDTFDELMNVFDEIENVLSFSIDVEPFRLLGDYD